MEDKNILRLAFARLTMKIADAVLAFCIPLLIYQITHSVAWAGFSFFFERLPRIIFLPFGGWMTDRFGSKRLMLISDMIRASILMIVFFLIRADLQKGVWLLPAVGAVISMMNAQSFVALEAFLSQIAHKKGQSAQVVYLQMADQASVIVAPLLAVAMQAMTSTLLLVPLAAGLYLFSMIFIVGTEDERANSGGTSAAPLLDLKKGFDYVKQDRRLIALAIWAFSLNLIGGLSLASSAALVTGRLGLAERDYGILQVSCGLISLLVMLLLPKFNFEKNLNRTGLYSYFAIVLGCFVVGFANNISTLILGYALLNAPVGIFNVYIRSKRAIWIKSNLRGTVTGILLLLGQMGLPAAGLLLGSLGGSAQTRLPFFVAGACAITLFILTEKISTESKVVEELKA